MTTIASTTQCHGASHMTSLLGQSTGELPGYASELAGRWLRGVVGGRGERLQLGGETRVDPGVQPRAGVGVAAREDLRPVVQAGHEVTAGVRHEHVDVDLRAG